MEFNTKEVWFSYYCPTCNHRNLTEDSDPCHDCLNCGHNENSHKPVNYDRDESTNYDPTPNCITKLNHLRGDYRKILTKNDIHR